MPWNLEVWLQSPNQGKWAKRDRLLFLDGEVDSWLVHGYIFLYTDYILLSIYACLSVGLSN